MKRLVVWVAVLVPLSFFVAGCGGVGGSSSKPSTPTTPEQKKQMQEMMTKGEMKMMPGTRGGTPGQAAKK